MRAWVAIAVCGCVEHGERPTRCEPDVELAGPGTSARRDVVVGDESIELCLRVDGRGHADPVLRATLPGLPITEDVVLVLHEPDGDTMTAQRPPLVWALEPGYLVFARLEIERLFADTTEGLPLVIDLEIVSGTERRDARDEAERVERVDRAPAALK